MDRVFKSLSHPDRRKVLFALYNHDPPLDMEAPTEETIIYQKYLEEQQVELVHRHLPMLEESGSIQWDRENKAVYQGPRFEEIESLLEVLEDHDEFFEPER
ncbi:ArsR family transcriptional regulator [Saliphagus infecundisoli]|uniref:ArsR family transcriptional regulator n=1 Tax=Saliphagus infecundisoli TaxID=1849069 RepID=A0ABD5QAB9_9EURY|nr:ArsR family transcriptional regulator [Saliphagus infecundisoli]